MNKYQVLGVVGEGAYGVVLKCRNKQTNELVAIKKFKDSDDDENVRRTTLREVRILKSLNMPNIVKLLDAFRRKGKIYLVFEYVDYNLLDLLERNVLGMPHEQILSLTYQLLKALLFCHKKDILHRDVKPENLLVTANDQLKLCDFGFARGIPNRPRPITRYVATRWYRAPELLLQSGVYGKAVDLWAVGCMMGEMFTGRPMFPGDSDIDQLHIVQRQVGPLTQEQMGIFKEKEEFAGLTLAEGERPKVSLSERYRSSMPADALDLMVKLLEMDENLRPTAEGAMRHHYFDSVREDPLLPPSPSEVRAAAQQQATHVETSTAPGSEGGGREGRVSKPKRSRTMDLMQIPSTSPRKAAESSGDVREPRRAESSETLSRIPPFHKTAVADVVSDARLLLSREGRRHDAGGDGRLLLSREGGRATRTRSREGSRSLDMDSMQSSFTPWAAMEPSTTATNKIFIGRQQGQDALPGIFEGANTSEHDEGSQRHSSAGILPVLAQGPVVN